MIEERSRISGVFCCPFCNEIAPFGALCDRAKCRRDSLDGIVAMASYGNPVLRELLHLYKYAGVADAGAALEDFFGIFLARHGPAFETLFESAEAVAVPLHFLREASRGFNQATPFANAIAKKFDLRRADPLRRRWRWASQASLDTGKRAANAARSVRMADGVRAPDSVILVDDVYTTGATLNECAHVLKLSGTKKVMGVVLLRG